MRLISPVTYFCASLSIAAVLEGRQPYPCYQDSCLQAVNGTQRGPDHPAIAQGNCRNYMTTTVVIDPIFSTSVVATTSTLTISPTCSSFSTGTSAALLHATPPAKLPLNKVLEARQDGTDPVATTTGPVPDYATRECTDAKYSFEHYSSACRCIGVTQGRVTSTSITVTSTETLTIIDTEIGACPTVPSNSTTSSPGTTTTYTITMSHNSTTSTTTVVISDPSSGINTGTVSRSSGTSYLSETSYSSGTSDSSTSIATKPRSTGFLSLPPSIPPFTNSTTPCATNTTSDISSTSASLSSTAGFSLTSSTVSTTTDISLSSTTVNTTSTLPVLTSPSPTFDTTSDISSTTAAFDTTLDISSTSATLNTTSEISSSTSSLNTTSTLPTSTPPFPTFDTTSVPSSSLPPTNTTTPPTPSPSAPLCSGRGVQNCAGICINTTDDPQHCGSCTNACATGFLCTNGVCTRQQCDSDCIFSRLCGASNETTTCACALDTGNNGVCYNRLVDCAGTSLLKCGSNEQCDVGSVCVPTACCDGGRCVKPDGCGNQGGLQLGGRVKFGRVGSMVVNLGFA